MGFWGQPLAAGCVQETMAGSPLTMGGLKGTLVVSLNLGVVENLLKNHGKPMENHGKPWKTHETP